MGSKTSSLALFPGSFDPMTLGHYDVVRRASHMFDSVVVAVGEARDKNPLFPLEDRIEMIRKVCSELDNIEVKSFDGLVVEFAKSVDAVAIVRGLRSQADFTYEMQMAQMNRVLNDSIETIFVPTSHEFSHISSSLAKEIAKHNGDLTKMVPPVVADLLRKRLK